MHIQTNNGGMSHSATLINATHDYDAVAFWYNRKRTVHTSDCRSQHWWLKTK